MDETTNKSASCMAITQKRAHRPAGCGSIFFQLFDWNRRFAKKKLFSQKSLAPADPNQTSKRFGENEKLIKSKLQLIADENRGGFPNPKKNSDEHRLGKNEMKSPGLVARLMGLESMPAIRRDKHKKIKSSKDKSVKEDFSLETSRPQKLQKTDMSDRHIVSRLGSEALQIKNALSRARKHHHHHHRKLPSPVKSARLSPAKRSSRLIDAAARVLEPGLQKAANRSKLSLTYVDSLHNKDVPDELGGNTPECGYNATSCRSCGSLVNVAGSRTNPFVAIDVGKPFVYPSAVSDSVANCFSEADKYSRDHFTVSFDQELIDAVNCDRSNFLPDEGNEKMQSSYHHRVGPPKDSKSVTSKNEDEAEKRILQGERFPRKGGRASSDVKAVRGMYKDFGAVNRGSSSKTPPRFPGKVGNFDIEMERHSCKALDDSALRAPVRKRRIASINAQAQNAGNVGSRSEKRNIHERPSTVSRSFSHEGSTKLGADAIEKAGFQREEKERRRAKNEQKTPRHVSPLQKFHELDSTSREADERATGDNIFRKSTDKILRDCNSSGNRRKTSCKQEMEKQGFTGYSDYTSPGSVLDASFSNESCVSSSFDDRSGGRLLLDSMEASCDHSQPSNTDIGILEDSVTSFERPVTNYATNNRLINRSSCWLNGINKTGIGLTKMQLGYAEEVILKMELLFETREFLIIPPLLDEIQILASSVCGNSDFASVLTRGFLLDCVIEHFDSRYCGCFYSGFEAWRKLHLPINLDMLARDVLEEVLNWAMLCGLPLDEIIVSEINHFLVKWNISVAEAFEVGVEIGCGLLHGLIDEVVRDLLVCS